MKILFLAHRMPYPPNKGEKIRAFHELRFLAARHTIDLFCFAETREAAKGQRALRAFCRHIYVERLNPTGAMLRAACGLLGKQPLSLPYFYSPRLRSAVLRSLAEENYDLIFIYCSSMAQYIPQPPPLPVVIDFVDIDSAKWAQYARFSPFPLSWVYAHEARCLARYERELASAFPGAVVATPLEAACLAGNGCPSVTVIGNGVSLPPNSDGSRLPEEVRRLQPYVLFVGTMNYRPNVDAVIYFSEEILPRIHRSHPELLFLIVGNHPTRKVRRLANKPGVVVTGGVPDLRPYFWGATAAVAPFRISQGVQNKILEALAAGLPVVSTSRPARAIGARHAETLIVADAPEEFAEAVISMLEDPALRNRFRNGAAFVREHFDWDRNLSRLESLLEAAVSRSKPLAVGEQSHARAC